MEFTEIKKSKEEYDCIEDRLPNRRKIKILTMLDGFTQSTLCSQKSNEKLAVFFGFEQKHSLRNSTVSKKQTNEN